MEVGKLDWSQVNRELPKLAALVPPRTDADHRHLARVIVLAQTGAIPESALQDAVGAVKAKRSELGNTAGYFRSVLRDNCSKAGVDLERELKHLRKIPSSAAPSRNGRAPAGDVANLARPIGTMPENSSDYARRKELQRQLADVLRAEKTAKK